MAVFTVSVLSPFPQENRTHSGNLIDSLLEAVNAVTIAAKRAERPKAPTYWFPKFQEWLTLDAAEYLEQLVKEAI
jgi:hypothetical protein